MAYLGPEMVIPPNGWFMLVHPLPVQHGTVEDGWCHVGFPKPKIFVKHFRGPGGPAVGKTVPPGGTPVLLTPVGSDAKVLLQKYSAVAEAEGHNGSDALWN